MAEIGTSVVVVFALLCGVLAVANGIVLGVSALTYQRMRRLERLYLSHLQAWHRD